MSGTLRSVEPHPPAGELGPLDERLRDDVVLAEIDLVSRLMIAASGAVAPLTGAEIDALLGLDLPVTHDQQMHER